MLTYLGQCDRLILAGNGDLWERMVALRKPISITQFEHACDLSRLLDEDETLDDFIRGTDAQFFASVWGDVPCMFIESSGFEFIFT